MVALSTLYLCAALSATPDAVLLEFTSPTCAPCQSMQPTIERLKKDGYPIQQINVEQAPDVARQFQIRHVPTCVLVVAGQEVARLDGVRSRDDIERLFQQAAATQPATTPVTQQAEDYVVRGQSPEGRRGLGLFNKLSGRKAAAAADPGARPTSIPTGDVMTSAAAVAQVGRDQAFSQHQPVAMPTSPSTQPIAERPVATASNPEQLSSRNSGTSPQQQALAATVRLKIEDPAGVSFGTGTIIDVLNDEALVVTCGHIFRESQGKGKISVDLHESAATGPVPGQLISFDLTRDIALVSIRPGVAVTAAVVASDPRKIVEGTRVFSIGCDHGREPSIHDSRVLAIDRYTGSPNYSVSGLPVQGRSGGGLFAADGALIGICNAADEKDNEGLYAGMGTIHWQLDQIGQTAIYQKQAVTEPTAVAVAPRNELPPRESFDSAPIRVPVTPVSNTNATPAGQEIIFFLRDKNRPGARGEAIVIDSPTPELIEALSRESRGNLDALSAGEPQPTGMRSLPEEAPVVVRGQSK